MINLDNSRRSYNIRCKWWKSDIKWSNLQKLDHKPQAAGIFYAREHQPTNKIESFDQDLVKIDSQNVVIETQDTVEGLSHECLVEYLGQIWMVDNVQTKMINKRSEYDIRPAKITWMTLRNKGE